MQPFCGIYDFKQNNYLVYLRVTTDCPVAIMELQNSEGQALIIEMGKMCRTCLEKTENLVEIVENDSVFCKFQNFSRIQLMVSQPNLICDSCLILLDICFKFKQQCESVNEILKKMISNDMVNAEHLQQLFRNGQLLRSFHHHRHGNLPSFPASNEIDVLFEAAEVPIEKLAGEEDQQDSISASVSHHESSSDDDDLTLSAHRNLLLNIKQDTKDLKDIEKSHKTMRTMEIQVGGVEGDSISIMEICDIDARSSVKINSRGTQTEWLKKRPRIRAAIPSPCTICEKVYKNGEILRQHMKSHHVEGPIQCEHCQASFVSIRSLKYHEQRNHSNLEPVPCSFCGKKFVDKKYLRTHENIHSQNNKFVCQFCGRSFVMKTNLSVHITRHHMPKTNDFICQVCGKSFPFKLYLNKHMKTHTFDKPHSCTQCDAKFREPALLRKHINSIHLKLRPFHCQYCNKTFTRSLYLKEHMDSQHLGIPKKIDCLECGGQFQGRGKLKNHECSAQLSTTSINFSEDNILISKQKLDLQNSSIQDMPRFQSNTSVLS